MNGIEKFEIEGDWYEEVWAAEEREEAHEAAPEPPEWTDEDLDAFEATTLTRDGEGTDPSGESVPRWKLA